MPKIKNFTKENLIDIRKDINAVMSAVKQKYEIDLKLGNISFSSNEFTSRLTVNTSDKSYKEDVMGLMNVFEQKVQNE